jgi:capsular polysaccharide biosynthesis protein
VDEPIDVRRYAAALRRSALLIVVVVVVATAVGLGVSASATKQYRATAKLAVDDSVVPIGTGDTAARRLATIRVLLTTNDVLATAARHLRGETATSLRAKVHATVAADANIISLSATDRRAAHAADVANTVATIALAAQRNRILAQVATTRQALLEQLAGLGRLPETDVQIQAIRDELSSLSVTAATAGSGFVVAEKATAPTGPVSPHPGRVAVLVACAALFLGVLLAIGREQLLR